MLCADTSFFVCYGLNGSMAKNRQQNAQRVCDMSNWTPLCFRKQDNTAVVVVVVVVVVVNAAAAVAQLVVPILPLYAEGRGRSTEKSVTWGSYSFFLS